MKIKFTIMVLLLCILTGCNTQNEEDFKEEAINLVNSNITESFEYTNAKTIDKKSGYYRYVFNSKERDLVMFVDSYIDNGKRVYVTNYQDVIQAYYLSQCTDYLKKHLNNYDSATQTITITDPGDIDYVAEVIYYCENLVTQENQYHSNYTTDNMILLLQLQDVNGKVFMQYDIRGYFNQEDISYEIYKMYDAYVENLD